MTNFLHRCLPSDRGVLSAPPPRATMASPCIGKIVVVVTVDGGLNLDQFGLLHRNKYLDCPAKKPLLVHHFLSNCYYKVMMKQLL